MKNKIQAIKILVFGKVQGVFFRAWAKEQAYSLFLVGWVKNLADGSVEIFVQGSKESLEKFLFSCLRGPTAAQVSKLVVEPLEPLGELENFEIRY
ncbi:MAG: acylphosphatase [Candidatus Micrarchaeota archaeon]|nr:acylphosphatase [Candidatus Micrarchaeota archaeon]